MTPTSCIKTFIACGILPVLLTGCGTVASNTHTDADLAEKAAFALNTSADRVSVLSRTANMDSVRFQVKSNTGVYNCYFTSVMGVANSDALCSGPIDRSPDTSSASSEPAANCNALLKAANRC